MADSERPAWRDGAPACTRPRAERDEPLDGRKGWRQVTGTGIRLNLRAPRNTILQVDLGKSVLPDVYRGAGSTVLQIMLLKPL
jgi:hypothetical protein